MERLVLGVFLSGAMTFFASANPFFAMQEPNPPAQERDTRATVTYGKIKELTPSQKVVIEVKNAIDKRFELNDKDLTVNLDNELKVGDMVKVAETKSALGKTKSVTITKHTGGSE
jgi:ribosomal protein S17